MTDVDVVVVGAGLSGLTAARDLDAAGLSVLVTEARDRVGGRTLNATVAGVNVDLGGTFIGPGQDRVGALAAELGCATHPTRTAGDNLAFWNGRVRRYSGTIPRVSPVTLADVERVRLQLERIMRRVPLGRPWDAPDAAELDAQTVASWLEKARATAGARSLVGVITKTAWGCEPNEISLLHFTHYLHACGGLNPMVDTEGGAQQDHFPEGAQQLSVRLADKLGEKVLLGAPTTRIEWSEDGATVTAGDTIINCRNVIVSVPPALRGRITFAPLLPMLHDVLPQRWPQGVISNVYVAYETPFWRAAGLSGQVVSDAAPIYGTFDTGPSDDGPGVLLGFVGGSYARDFATLPPAERKLRALSAFATFFGAAALNPIDYIEQQWGQEPWSGGGPTSAVPPGAWTSYGRALAAPVGPIHWAGSETADKWPGYLDGAVSAGERAAREIRTRVQGVSA
ncbi:flavin monoamine oxidase family protein [Antrihabitans stalactiti]|uniref:flavin monoamine oxidase family protein n=1 Tax=Antrihabitans stalactiti TaxID=2584121 RepID=UPI0030B828D1